MNERRRYRVLGDLRYVSADDGEVTLHIDEIYEEFCLFDAIWSAWPITELATIMHPLTGWLNGGPVITDLGPARVTA